MIEKIKAGVKYLLEQPEANSRFVFLIHGIATALGTVILTVGFLVVHDRSGFPTMAAAIGGTAGLSAVGRFLTKKAGNQDTPEETK